MTTTITAPAASAPYAAARLGDEHRPGLRYLVGTQPDGQVRIVRCCLRDARDVGKAMMAEGLGKVRMADGARQLINLAADR